MQITLNFGSFRLEFGSDAPGVEDPPLWLYQNSVGDGMEVNPAEIDELLRQYFAENM